MIKEEKFFRFSTQKLLFFPAWLFPRPPSACTACCVVNMQASASRNQINSTCVFTRSFSWLLIKVLWTVTGTVFRHWLKLTRMSVNRQKKLASWVRRRWMECLSFGWYPVVFASHRCNVMLCNDKNWYLYYDQMSCLALAWMLMMYVLREERERAVVRMKLKWNSELEFFLSIFIMRIFHGRRFDRALVMGARLAAATFRKEENFRKSIDWDVSIRWIKRQLMSFLLLRSVYRFSFTSTRSKLLFDCFFLLVIWRAR